LISEHSQSQLISTGLDSREKEPKGARARNVCELGQNLMNQRSQENSKTSKPLHKADLDTEMNLNKVVD
jgi:hypothetical protein